MAQNVSRMIATMCQRGECTWEELVGWGLVDPASISGLTDAEWLVGDDVICDADDIIKRRTGAAHIATSSLGLYLEDSDGRRIQPAPQE